MDRDQFTGLFDLGLNMALAAAASTATPHDDTAVRYLKFARSDASFEQFLDWKFGPQTAPLMGDDGATVLSEDEADAKQLRASTEEFGKREQLNAEQVAMIVTVISTVFQAIKKLREQRKAAQPPAT